MSTRAKVWIAAAIVALAGLWMLGTFDTFLAPAGLNSKDCLRDANSVMLCGDEAANYEKNLERERDVADREWRKYHPTASEEVLGPAEMREAERESDEGQEIIEEMEASCKADPRCRAEMENP
ncbi:MAG: hypothetical protein WD827_07215 [Solirubrobacterales bacterium]